MISKFLPKRRFSFYRLHEHMSLRKDFKKEVRIHNEKFARKFMRYDDQIKDYVKQHPFKTGFFIGFIALTKYFQVYSWLSSIIFFTEPIRKKLRRWILGENNLPPDSIMECDNYEIQKFLDESNRVKLGLIYLKVDAELYYGVSYKLLKMVMND